MIADTLNIWKGVILVLKPNYQLYDKFIINDLVLKTLEIDRNKIGDFKMHLALENWFKVAIEKTNEDGVRIREVLRKAGIKFDNFKKVADLITDYYFKEQGQATYVRYSKYYSKKSRGGAYKNLNGYGIQTI